MTPHHLLGQLNNIHELLAQLIEDLPDSDCNRRFHPDIPSPGWLFGRSIYLETYWLRERLRNDDDLTGRVRHIFAAEGIEQEQLLPPKQHLLNWAAEIRDNHLSELANPGLLPDHPLITNGWLAGYLIQIHGKSYERMLSSLTARALASNGNDYLSRDPLRPRQPVAYAVDVSQGHYRIGGGEVVFDNELPRQVVELHNFRISHLPVSNAEYLAFMEDGGYTDDAWWNEPGLAWRNGRGEEEHHPWQWRRDAKGHWYSVGLNGPYDLTAEDPVSGISQHEARAYARWAAKRIDGLQGAVLQHEFQWETAVRSQHIRHFGRVWEWCANPLAAHNGYEAPEDPELRTAAFDGQHFTLKGGSLHTQPSLRRPGFRHYGPAGSQFLFSGARLVLPPQ